MKFLVKFKKTATTFLAAFSFEIVAFAPLDFLHSLLITGFRNKNIKMELALNNV